MNRANLRRFGRIATLATVAALAGGLTASPAAADQIGLTDGRVYEGRVVHVDVDGVRIDWPEGWVHVRGSNTEPIMRVSAERDAQLIVIGTIIGINSFLVLFFLKTEAGLSIRALGEDSELAEVFGMSPREIKYIIFVGKVIIKWFWELSNLRGILIHS